MMVEQASTVEEGVGVAHKTVLPTRASAFFHAAGISSGRVCGTVLVLRYSHKQWAPVCYREGEEKVDESLGPVVAVFHDDHLIWSDKPYLDPVANYFGKKAETLEHALALCQQGMKEKRLRFEASRKKRGQA